MKKYIFAAALCSLALGATAEINVDFETPESYKSVGVWDNWEASPFRTGVMKGNFAVTANPDASVSEISGVAPNDSKLVLGAQRSRFGSNFFGARVDLPETFELTPQLKYVHVMLYKTATSGRVMLIGLGKRQERYDQSPETTQFRVMASNAIETGCWTDAVFAVKGAGGIDIHSLVVVPDCESPHALGDDFLFYVDNIIVDNSASPRINNEYYPVFGTKSVAMTRTDRVTTGVYLVAANDTVRYAVNQSTSKKLYTDLTGKVFYAKPGQTVTPGIDVSFTNWMHSYCYIDYNNNGTFNSTDELVAYNHYQGTDSKGTETEARQQNSVGIMPSFTIPADTKPGMYRIRFKVDWDCIDPAGCSVEGQLITSNGGSVTDAMICIYGNNVTVNDFQLNGEVLAENGDKLNSYAVPADQPFAIKSAPEKGFHNGGVNLNFGYNLTEDRVDKYGNPQYITTFVPLDSFDETTNVYTIPAEMMRGDLLINGNMVEDGPVGPCEEAYFLNFPEDLKMTRDDRHLNSLTITTPEGAVIMSIPTGDLKKIYHNFLNVEVPVKAGETVTPAVDYTGRAMSSYIYVDFDENGEFSTDLNDDGTPKGEMLSYGFYNNKNSKGESIEKGGDVSPGNIHPFVIPANTPEGLYRCRLKIDWNYINPAGHYGENNNDIDANGGAVLDFLFHVHSDVAKVTSTHLATINDQPLPMDAPRNQELLVAPVTTDGKAITSIVARNGYKLDAISPVKYSHTYWRETELGVNSDKAFIVPASIVDRPVHLFATVSGITGLVELDLVSSDEPAYDLQGRVSSKASRGVIISKGRKIIK